MGGYAAHVDNATVGSHLVDDRGNNAERGGTGRLGRSITLDVHGRVSCMGSTGRQGGTQDQRSCGNLDGIASGEAGCDHAAKSARTGHLSNA